MMNKIYNFLRLFIHFIVPLHGTYKLFKPLIFSQIKMKRKDYKKPTMQIVLLKGGQPLLAGSANDRPDYDPTNDNPFAEL